MSPRMHGGEVVGRMLLRPFCTKDLCSRLLRAMSGRGRCCLVSFLPSNKAPGGHRVFLAMMMTLCGTEKAVIFFLPILFRVLFLFS